MDLKSFYERLKLHAVDSTSLLVVGLPLFSIGDVVSGVSNNTSINARVLATGLCYAGIGLLFAGGRDLAGRVTGINDSSSEKARAIHDGAYMALFNLAYVPALFYTGGSRDLEEVARGTTVAVGISVFLGYPSGFAIDAFRDLFGFQKTDRLPNRVRELGSSTKKYLGAATVAAAISVMSLTYALNPHPAGCSSNARVPMTLEYQSTDSISIKNSGGTATR